MKYLLVLSLFLIGCTEEQKPKIELIKGLSSFHECNLILRLGFKIDRLACVKHIDHPKYKVGQQLHMLNSVYSRNCVFTVYRPAWSHGNIFNEPYYYGSITCRDKTDHLIFYVEDNEKNEKDLIK